MPSKFHSSFHECAKKFDITAAVACTTLQQNTSFLLPIRLCRTCARVLIAAAAATAAAATRNLTTGALV